MKSTSTTMTTSVAGTVVIAGLILAPAIAAAQQPVQGQSSQVPIQLAMAKKQNDSASSEMRARLAKMNEQAPNISLLASTGEPPMARFSMTCAAITFALAELAAHTTLGAEQPGEKSSAAKVRVGTFDSRAVAMAYIRSEAFERRFKGLKAEYEKAKAAGDQKRVEELEAEGREGQELVHKQGFGTWPVDNILDTIKEKIPGIAKQAGVDVVVSKWDVVYQRSGVELVDVTNLMVQPFDPDESTLKLIQEVLKGDPVPLEELKNHKH